MHCASRKSCRVFNDQHGAENSKDLNTTSGPMSECENANKICDYASLILAKTEMTIRYDCREQRTITPESGAKHATPPQITVAIKSFYGAAGFLLQRGVIFSNKRIRRDAQAADEDAGARARFSDSDFFSVTLI